MKRELTYADQAKRIKKKYKGRTDKLSMDSMHRELAALEQQQEAVRAQMNLIEPQQMAAWGGPGGYVNQPDNNLLAMGGMIKRADGSYSKKGLWDNIRANKGSGKKPTAEMLKQEKKIKAEYAMGGMMYANGGGIDNPGFKALPIEVQNNIKNNMAMGGKYVTAGNEYHKVYRNADGDIMVNHPKEDKGKWDTINLTKKANANTIAEGVKSVKDWHKNNPYAYGGMIYAMGGEIESAIDPAFFSHGGGIHIDPSKKGTFTAAATKHGKSVQGFASQVLANKENYSPAMVKKANFAKNASKWKHAYGGPMGMYFDGTGDEYNGIPYETAGPREDGLSIMYNTTEDGLKYLTPQPTPEFEMPYDQMVKTFAVPPSQEDYPVTAKVPFKPGYSEQKPKQKFDAGDLAYLGNLASPLIQLFGTKKQPYDYQRVSPELVKYNPNTTADLIRRGNSLPMYLVKKQGLGQGNYLNMMGILSGKAGENIGQANLEGQMKEQIANAGIKNETNRYNAEVQRLQQEAAAKEYAGRLKSYVTAAQGFGNTLSQYVLDKRARKESEENKQLMKDYTDKHFSYLDKQLEAMKPKSIYDYNSSSTLPSFTLPVSSTFKKSIPTNLEFNLPKSKYGLFK